MVERLVAVIQFDASATFEEFQQIAWHLLEKRFKVELDRTKSRGTVVPYYSDWKLIVTKETTKT